MSARMSARSRGPFPMTLRTRAERLLACVALGSAILLALLWLPRRGAARLDPLARAEPGEPDSRPDLVLAGERSPSTRSEPESPGALSESERPAPTFLTGWLVLDDEIVPGGWVRIASADGTFDQRTALGLRGRFYLRDVPITALDLTIELPPIAQRIVLLPRLELEPQAGQPLELRLEWHTRQVNLRVLDPSGKGTLARVEVAGPRVASHVETGQDGRAMLAVIDPGRFRFQALALDGSEGEAELELDPGDDLGSVVVVVQPAADGR